MGIAYRELWELKTRSARRQANWIHIAVFLGFIVIFLSIVLSSEAQWRWPEWLYPIVFICTVGSFIWMFSFWMWAWPTWKGGDPRAEGEPVHTLLDIQRFGAYREDAAVHISKLLTDRALGPLSPSILTDTVDALRRASTRDPLPGVRHLAAQALHRFENSDQRELTFDYTRAARQHNAEPKPRNAEVSREPKVFAPSGSRPDRAADPTPSRSPPPSLSEPPIGAVTEKQASLLAQFRECSRPTLNSNGSLPGSHWDWHKHDLPVCIAAELIRREPSIKGLRAQCSDRELVEIIAFASHYGYGDRWAILFNRGAIEALGEIRTPIALGRLQYLVDQTHRPRSERQPAIDALNGAPGVKGVSDLMEEYECNSVIYYRWESEDDAMTVFTSLRTGQFWLPAESIVVRIDGRQIAPYQPFWIAICWPNEKLRVRPFRDWWQYMEAVDLPDQQGWKAGWELDCEERLDYSRRTKVLEYFSSGPPMTQQRMAPTVSSYVTQAISSGAHFSLDGGVSAGRSAIAPKQLPEGPADADETYFDTLLSEFRKQPQPQLASNGSCKIEVPFREACYTAASLMMWKHGFAIARKKCARTECEQLLLIGISWSNEVYLRHSTVEALAKIATPRCIEQLELIAGKGDAPSDVRESARNSLLLLGRLPRKR